jgi:hypothetical protein
MMALQKSARAGARARSKAKLFMFFLIFCSIACSSNDGGSTPHESSELAPAGSRWLELVDVDAWELDSAEQDPLAEHRGDHVFCGLDALSDEEHVEISTTECNYASVSQDISEPLEAGNVLRVVAWWGVLTAEAPTEAHFSVLLDGDLIWERFLEVPGPANVADVQLLVERDYDAFVRATVHVHNHGNNSWRLGQLAVARQRD